MRYVAAYLLAALGGNKSPSVADIQAILESAGIGFDGERAEIVVNNLKDKDLNELIAEGRKKMASMPSGAGAAAASGAAPAAGAAEDKVEEKKEEKKEESEEESDDDMGFGLFD